MANAQINQVQAQITAANDRLTIAQSELDLQNEQVANANAISDFLSNKYTNTQLYDWMAAQLTTLYTQSYQLALSLAQQAQHAYNFELSPSVAATFLQTGYWDSAHKGLLAAENLLFDLRRMEASYVANNVRERELTKTISLALTQPASLVALIQGGSCTFQLDEALFETDHPGQYRRRLRSVALTIPCVTGPYVGVNAELWLNNATIRLVASGSGTNSPAQSAGVPVGLPTFSYNGAPAVGISTSSAQNDAGLFDVNLRDERWLPFEGLGAISQWTLTLSPSSNAFDLSTISDVLLHVRYTAMPGTSGPPAVPAPTFTPTIPAVLISVKSLFPDAYAAFLASMATSPTLQVPITANLLPYSSQSLSLTGLTLFVLAPGPTLTPVAVSSTPSPGPLQTYSFNVPMSALPTGTGGTPAFDDIWLVVAYKA